MNALAVSTANIDTLVIGLLLLAVWIEPVAKVREWLRRQRPIDDVATFAETRTALREATGR